ncbi:MAG: hypothetical protein ACLRT4_18095 [Thomasclavelia sp.]
MIEKIILDYLSKELNVPVFLEEPVNSVLEYVIIEKTGGTKENFISYATFAIQSYSTTLYKTAMLNEKVKQAMDNIIILDDISKSTLNSDYNFTDTAKKKYRYQAVYDLVY